MSGVSPGPGEVPATPGAATCPVWIPPTPPPDPGRTLHAEIAAAVDGRAGWVPAGDLAGQPGPRVVAVYRVAAGRPGGSVYGYWSRGATRWWWTADNGLGEPIGTNLAGDPELTAVAAVEAVEAAAAFPPAQNDPTPDITPTATPESPHV